MYGWPLRVRNSRKRRVLCGVAGAEKDEVPVAAADELEAAEDESAHEHFAQLGVFGDERAEGVAGRVR